MVARRPPRRAAGPVIGGFVLLVFGLLASCGAAEDELTTEEQLEKLAGQTLTSTEVEEQLALADTMCAFDDAVLGEIWDQLDSRQLEFQDWVFGQHCPDRLPDYEAARPDTGVVDPAILETTTTTMDPALMAEAVDLLESVGTMADDPPTTNDPPTTTTR
ncbi:MAG: hypothetical protein ACR2QO_27210 [Acidimicrobiales bacterium]